MQKVNKLICVRPLKSRYVGEIGDVIVGRVLEVQQKRWKVETNSRLDSILQLSSVNLPGGELVSCHTLHTVCDEIIKIKMFILFLFCKTQIFKQKEVYMYNITN